VQVSNRYDTILAGPHEMIELEEGDHPLAKTSVTDALYKYYRTREFDCDNTPLWKLVETLNEAYDAHISIGRPSLRNLLLSTTFHDESLDRILTVIAETFSIRVSRNGDQIVLQ
jgi:transmembrane sensor